MTWWARTRSVVRRMFHADATERSLDNEIQSYLQHDIDARIRSGIRPEDARRAALAALGGVTQVKEAVRESRSGAWVDHLVQDAEYAARRLRRSPGTTVVSMVALACAIGAAAAAWSLLTAALLRPLPVSDPHGLAVVGLTHRFPDGREMPYALHAYPAFEWIRDTDALQALVATGGESLEVAASGIRGPAHARYVSHDFLRVLGVAPAMGRDFTADDDRPGAPLVAILSNRYWTRVFGADPDVVGREILVSGRPATIVGVAPRGFRGLNLSQTWDLYLPGIGGRRSLMLVGRVSAGSDMALTAARLDALIRSAWSQDRSLPLGQPSFVTDPPTVELTDVNTAAVPLRGREGMSRLARLLALTVGSLLLMGCTTAGMFLLIRVEGRRTEFAMQIALGASRWRIARGVVFEGALLAAGGALLALPVAHWLFAGIRAFQLPGRIDIELLELSLGGATVAAVAAAAVAATLVIAAIAGGAAGRIARAPRLETAAMARPVRRLPRSILVVAHVAVALVLLAGAGLFGRSIIAALGLNPGVDTNRIVTGLFSLPEERYTPPQAAAFSGDLLDRLSGSASIDAASIAWFSADQWSGDLRVDGELRQIEFVHVTAVDDRYFRVIGTPILRGRDFLPGDRAGAPQVVIVNESLGRVLAGGGDAVGRRITFPSRSSDASVLEIIGVVQDTIYSVNQLEPLAAYVPRAQITPPATARSQEIILRAASGAASAAREAAGILTHLEPGVAADPLRSIDERLREELGPQQFGVHVLGGLGVIAALLTMLGAYVMAAAMVAERRREMGIRAALGASGWRLGGLVLGESATLVGVGLLVGLGLAWLGAGLIEPLLFNTEALDPATLAGVSVCILTLTLAVSLKPAAAALRLDVAQILRSE